MEIRLTPTGQLRWEAPEGETESAVFAPLRKAFQADWREGLFTLAAEKINLDAPTLRYWQALAERYLTGLCHIPGAMETFEVEAPSPADCASLVLTAPPMQGGEYLSDAVLQHHLGGPGLLGARGGRRDGWTRNVPADAGAEVASGRAGVLSSGGKQKR